MRFSRKYDGSIYPAKPDQVPVLASIHELCFDRSWNEDEIASSLRNENTLCFVAGTSRAGIMEPSGFLIVRSAAGQSEILTLAVHPKRRNTGIARALLTHAIRELQKERVEILFLEVSEANEPALALYRAMNFAQISIRKSYYSHSSGDDATKESGKRNALVMQLDLR